MNADTFLRKWFQPWPFVYLFRALRKWNSQMAWKSSKARNIKFGSLCIDQCIIWSPCWCFRFQFWSIYVPSWMFYWNWRIHNLNSKTLQKEGTDSLTISSYLLSKWTPPIWLKPVTKHVWKSYGKKRGLIEQ